MNVFQLLNVSFCIVFPIIALLSQKRSWLLFWIGFSITLECLGLELPVNISALKILGIILIPYCFRFRCQFKGNIVLKIILFQFCYLLLIGLGSLLLGRDTVFEGGASIQWLRPIILTLGSKILEFIPALYMCIVFMDNANDLERSFQSVVYGVWCGAIVLCCGVFIEIILKMDIYSLVKFGARTLYLPDRARGVSYEPRTVCQILAICSGFIMYFPFSTYKKIISLFLISIVSFLFTSSLSGVIILIFIVLISALLKICVNLVEKKSYYLKNLRFEVFMLCISLFWIFIPNFFRFVDDYRELNDGIGNSKLFSHTVERSYILKPSDSNISSRLEIFDAAAVHFFEKNPLLLISGVGPGLVSFWAYPYVLKKDLYLIGETHRRTRSIGQPLMGGVRVLAEGGGGGILFVFLIFIVLRKRIYELIKHNDKFLFSIIASLGAYLLQVNYFWVIGLSIIIYIGRNVPKNACSDSKTASIDSLSV